MDYSCPPEGNRIVYQMKVLYVIILIKMLKILNFTFTRNLHLPLTNRGYFPVQVYLDSVAVVERISKNMFSLQK